MSTQLFDPVGYKAGQRRDWTEAAAGWRKWWQALETALGPVGDRLIELAAIRPGHRVLDVATGIGEPALTAAGVVGSSGRVVGTDISPGMLGVARARATDLGIKNAEFHEMDAEALDLPEGTFNAVLCRFGLMFLPNVEQALGGIRRLLVPGGGFAASTWGPPDRNPMNAATFAAIARVLQLPPPAAGTPGIFSLADGADLARRVQAAGFVDLHTETLAVRSEFESLEAYVRFLQDVAAPIRKLLAGESRERRSEVWEAVADANREFVGHDGRFYLSGESLLVRGRR
jgi:SAM-dependent methyltransferase